MNKEVKASIRKLKREALDKKVKKLEADYQKHDSLYLFKMVKELEDKPRKALSILKDSNGIKHTDSEAVLGLWKEHFEGHLNTAFLVWQLIAEKSGLMLISGDRKKYVSYFSLVSPDSKKVR